MPIKAVILGKLGISVIKPVIENGRIEKTDTSLIIINTDLATIYVSIGTNFISYRDLSANPAERAGNYLEGALQKEYVTALRDHISFYRKYFDRVSLDLGKTDSVNNPTDIRLKQFRNGNDPQLAELYPSPSCSHRARWRWTPHFSPHPYMLQLHQDFGYGSNRDFQENTINYSKDHLID